MEHPAVHLYSPSDFDREANTRKFRLEGGDIAPGWTVREGHRAWCDLTVNLDRSPQGRIYVTVFRGEVWPGAWPALFEHERIGGAPSTFLTEEGERVLFAALPESERP